MYILHLNQSAVYHSGFSNRMNCAPKCSKRAADLLTWVTLVAVLIDEINYIDLKLALDIDTLFLASVNVFIGLRFTQVIFLKKNWPETSWIILNFEANSMWFTTISSLLEKTTHWLREKFITRLRHHLSNPRLYIYGVQ